MRRTMAQSRGSGIDNDLHVTDSAGDSGWEMVKRGNSPTSTTEYVNDVVRVICASTDSSPSPFPVFLQLGNIAKTVAIPFKRKIELNEKKFTQKTENIVIPLKFG